jgi:hypothetical protein
MVFLTTHECTDWCNQKGISVPAGGDAGQPGPSVRVGLNPEASLVFSAASRLVEAIGPWTTSLLWVVATDIWPSTTNLHLYYRVRQSYQDFGLVAQAPGHLFLNYELADFVTFIQIGILSGWDMYVLTDLGYGKAFVSHESWAAIWASNEKDLDGIVESFKKIRVPAEIIRATP